ncbi:MAG: hypothetical protein MUD09_00540 [Desulfobacterales bacterium]|jgi:hypothetical protein|nr:hypothetical protein [Desulfobacterales bacterium]
MGLFGDVFKLGKIVLSETTKSHRRPSLKRHGQMAGVDRECYDDLMDYYKSNGEDGPAAHVSAVAQ